MGIFIRMTSIGGVRRAVAHGRQGQQSAQQDRDQERQTHILNP